MEKFFRAFQISLLAILSFCVFSCAKTANEKMEFVAPEGQEDPESPALGLYSENLDELGELRLATDIDSYGTYYRFGIFPQTNRWDVYRDGREIKINERVRWSDIHPESTLADGSKYFLGSDNCWYERVVREWFDDYSGEYRSEKVYYKVEPIIWKVFKELPDNKIMLVPTNVLTNSEFYHVSGYNDYEYPDYDDYRRTIVRDIYGEEIWPNNYEYSRIRAYINSYDGRFYGVENFSSSGFLTKAFTLYNRDLILETEVDNSIDTVKTWSRTEWVQEWNEDIKDWVRVEEIIEENQYVCKNTFDKVFLLSYKDLENGFLDVFTTSYALDNGCAGWFFKDYNKWMSPYYMRSPVPYAETQVSAIWVHDEWDEKKQEYTSLYYEYMDQWCASSWFGVLPAIVIERP